jgi:hypothetical protein
MLVGIPFGGIKPAKKSLFLYLALILTPLEEKKSQETSNCKYRGILS